MITDEELQNLLEKCEAIKVDCICEWASCKTCRAIGQFEYALSPHPKTSKIEWSDYGHTEKPGHEIVSELIKEVQEFRNSDIEYLKDYVKHLEEQQIQMLILRVRLGWLSQQMELSKELTAEDCAKQCQELIKRAMDSTRCNNPCKSIYFCDKEKGHKGRHFDGNLNWE